MNHLHDDILISRAIDGDATAAEWDQLTARAETDPTIWRNLATTLREHGAFGRAINAGVAVADSIEMPAPAITPTARPTGTLPRVRRQAGLRGWSGWAIAAVLSIAWVSGVLNLVQTNPATPGGGSAQPLTRHTGFGDNITASQLLQAYLDKGRQEDFVIAEVPQRVLIQTRPSGTGRGYELLYLRQILERTVVPDLYEFYSQDEMGRPTLVRYDGNRGPSM